MVSLERSWNIAKGRSQSALSVIAPLAPDVVLQRINSTTNPYYYDARWVYGGTDLEAGATWMHYDPYVSTRAEQEQNKRKAKSNMPSEFGRLAVLSVDAGMLRKFISEYGGRQAVRYVLGRYDPSAGVDTTAVAMYGVRRERGGNLFVRDPENSDRLRLDMRIGMTDPLICDIGVQTRDYGFHSLVDEYSRGPDIDINDAICRFV